MKLSLLTATYNHPQNLKSLYSSLLLQNDKDFEWIIINDGSESKTEEVVNGFIDEQVINIKYLFQSNSGKSSAINKALDLASNSDFAIIIDDDEQLNPDAILIVKDYYYRYKDKCACINFNRSDLNGVPLTNGQELRDRFMSFQLHKSLKLHADGYVAYYMDTLGNTRFPLYNGEKYVGPSVLMMLSSKCKPILWASAVLGKTEYLEGGITKKGRTLRLKNPRGMILHAALMMHKDSSLRVKIGFSIHAFAYKYYANLSDEELKTQGLNMGNFIPMQLFGYILSRIWIRKFGVLTY